MCAERSGRVVSIVAFAWPNVLGGAASDNFLASEPKRLRTRENYVTRMDEPTWSHYWARHLRPSGSKVAMAAALQPETLEHSAD